MPRRAVYRSLDRSKSIDEPGSVRWSSFFLILLGLVMVFVIYVILENTVINPV